MIGVEEEEERQPGVYTPEERFDLIAQAFTRLSEEWLQNELGIGITDILFDALYAYEELLQQGVSTP